MVFPAAEGLKSWHFLKPCASLWKNPAHFDWMTFASPEFWRSAAGLEPRRIDNWWTPSRRSSIPSAAAHFQSGANCGRESKPGGWRNGFATAAPGRSSSIRQRRIDRTATTVPVGLTLQCEACVPAGQSPNIRVSAVAVNDLVSPLSRTGHAQGADIRSLESVVQGFEERATRLEADIKDAQKRAVELETISRH